MPANKTLKLFGKQELNQLLQNAFKSALKNPEGREKMITAFAYIAETKITDLTAAQVQNAVEAVFDYVNKTRNREES